MILRLPIQRKERQFCQGFSQGQYTNRELSVVNWKYKGMDMNTERMVKLYHLKLQSCKLTLAVAGSVVLVTQRGESLIVTDWKSVAWASIQSTAIKTRYI